MLTMDVTHPDIEDFITIKQDLKKVTGANISVRISDEFMQAVEDNTDFTQRWPIDNPDPQYNRVVKARDLWEKIIASAHNTAEPGHYLLGPPAQIFDFVRLSGLPQRIDQPVFGNSHAGGRLVPSDSDQYVFFRQGCLYGQSLFRFR